MSRVNLTVEGNHIVLTVDGVPKYESDIGTIPPIEPTPVPTPEPVKPPPPRSTVNYSLYMGLTRSQAEWQQLDKRVPGWSWEEFEASGFMEPDAEADTSTPTTGYVLASSGRPLTNMMHAGVTYTFSVPHTSYGERVTIKILEVQGTPSELVATSTVYDSAGKAISGPSSWLPRGTAHSIVSPGGPLTVTVTTSMSAPLGVQRG